MNEENLTEPTNDALAPSEGAEETSTLAASPQADDMALPTQLGATRYVLAGFFATGMSGAYVLGKALSAGWNRLADNLWVSQRAPFLSGLSEDDRATYTTLVGAVIGLTATIYAYRRDDVRTWTNEVAVELAKVTWPSKREVTNSTVVVVMTATFATVFLALLDRFWGFVTNLVYGS